MNGLWNHNTLLFGEETLPRSLEKEVTASQDHYVMGEGELHTGGQSSVAQDGELKCHTSGTASGVHSSHVSDDRREPLTESPSNLQDTPDLSLDLVLSDQKREAHSNPATVHLKIFNRMSKQKSSAVTKN